MIVAVRQEATHTNSRAAYWQFATPHNNLVKATSTCGEQDFKFARQHVREPKLVDSLVSASEIVKRSLSQGRRVLVFHHNGDSQHLCNRAESCWRHLQHR